MNARTFNTNTANSQTAYDGMRTRAGISFAARGMLASAKMTIVMMPDRWRRSAIIQTAKVPQNCTTTAIGISWMRSLKRNIARQNKPEDDAPRGDDEDEGER